MAAKKPRQVPKHLSRMTDEHRAKIANSNTLNALLEHVEGRREMKATQVTAALGLLDRVMPKLQAATIEGTGEKGEIVFRTIIEK